MTIIKNEKNANHITFFLYLYSCHECETAEVLSEEKHVLAVHTKENKTKVTGPL